MELVHHNRDSLIDYITAQVNHICPDRFADDTRQEIATDFDEALARLRKCINAVKMWKPERFDALHSSQHCIFNYFLANTIWRNREREMICTKLFLLNKALHGFDCFFNNPLPDIFFIGHSVGIVLARATFGNYLVLYQNSTVGRIGDKIPVIGEGVVMYPNSGIIGGCSVGDNTVIAQGQSLVNRNSDGNCIIFNDGKDIITKKLTFDPIEEYFRKEES